MVGPYGEGPAQQQIGPARIGGWEHLVGSLSRDTLCTALIPVTNISIMQAGPGLFKKIKIYRKKGGM